MNILLEQLPEAILIDGVEYPINYDFRSCLRTILAFEDDELTGREKQYIMLSNLYKEIPDNIEMASIKAAKFLNGGAEETEEESQVRTYSFSKDANLIFSAFKQTHGIDLVDIKELHWWKFLALFMDIGSDTAICSLINLRKRVKTGKATKEEKELANEMGDMFVLKEFDDRSLEERKQDEEFFALLNRGRQ